jgi:hypothetical protein
MRIRAAAKASPGAASNESLPSYLPAAAQIGVVIICVRGKNTGETPT